MTARRKQQPKTRRRAGILKAGTPVTWGYRKTRGHGYVESLASRARKASGDRYRLRQVDNHVSATGRREKKTVIHTRGDIRRSTKTAVDAAAARARARSRRGGRHRT